MTFILFGNETYIIRDQMAKGLYHVADAGDTEYMIKMMDCDKQAKCGYDVSQSVDHPNVTKYEIAYNYFGSNHCFYLRRDFVKKLEYNEKAYTHSSVTERVQQLIQGVKAIHEAGWGLNNLNYSSYSVDTNNHLLIHNFSSAVEIVDDTGVVGRDLEALNEMIMEMYLYWTQYHEYCESKVSTLVGVLTIDLIQSHWDMVYKQILQAESEEKMVPKKV